MADIRTEPSTPDTQSLGDYRALESSVSNRTQSTTGSNEVSSEPASDLSTSKIQQSDVSHQSTSTVNDDEAFIMTPVPEEKVAEQLPQSRNEDDAIQADPVEEDPLLLKKMEAGVKAKAGNYLQSKKNAFLSKLRTPKGSTMQTVDVGGGYAETNLGGTPSTAAGSTHGNSQQKTSLSPITEKPQETSETASADITSPMLTETISDTSNTSNRARIVWVIFIAIGLFVVAVLALLMCVYLCEKIHGSNNNSSTNELKEHSSGTAEVKLNATDPTANMTDLCLDWAMHAATNTTGQHGYNMTNIDWGRCANVTANTTTSQSANLPVTNASETATG
ncbi:hypothetical protein HA402_005925 [Bradysia odoriphaga]|nr:hypothetical protein HA402_005925 [Bradysia odoriphaga]